MQRPVRWLAAFATAVADPGEEVDVAVDVPVRGLAHWDATSQEFTVEAGEFGVAAGRSAGDLRVSGTLLAEPS